MSICVAVNLLRRELLYLSKHSKCNTSLLLSMWFGVTVILYYLSCQCDIWWLSYCFSVDFDLKNLFVEIVKYVPSVCNLIFTVNLETIVWICLIHFCKVLGCQGSKYPRAFALLSYGGCCIYMWLLLYMSFASFMCLM